MRAVSKALGAILTAAALTAAAPLAASAATVSPATSHVADGPSGFYYGTDSLPAAVTGNGPYYMPALGSGYGGFLGMAENWARMEGCTTGSGKLSGWSLTNSAQANTNYTKYGAGIGTGVYSFMGGPGVDPHWNGTASEASAWGALQAADTLTAMKSLNVTYPVVWADIEMPEIGPAPDNGWNQVYTSPCSGHVKQQHTPATVDRAEFNGFANYITTHSKYKVGVYSSAPIWTNIFGTGTASLIPNTYEWTYLPETSQVSVTSRAVGWCLAGTRTCAQFFGGQTSSSKYALMWQWSGGGGIVNSYHTDFDQIDTARVK